MDDLELLCEKIKGCSMCGLRKTCARVVCGEGSSSAEVVFIGEAPGREEDKQGRPFVGAAGKLLTELLLSIGFSRDDIYITNVVKCRPPNNRDPLPEEISACLPHLKDQLMIIKPKLIVTLGRHAMNIFLPGLKISEVHGQAKRANGLWNNRQVYLPLYHPAAALYDSRKRETLFDDFKKIILLLKKVTIDPS